MANHCVEVICLKCGIEYCTRGCGFWHGPSEAALARYLAKSQEWADRFAQGQVRHVITEGTCSCGGELAIT